MLAFWARWAHDFGVAYNFVRADRDQQFLLPPNMADWLPADHLAWFVIDVVDEIDLERFRVSYRADGHGRAAYDPAMMVALLLYAYCSGVRSSRMIERRCVEDIAFRVLAGGLLPDHVTIARFRQRHADALAEVLIDSLRLCAEAGLLRLGAVALDGTKVGANASKDANRTADGIDELVVGMLADAEAVDAAEDRDDTTPVPPDLVDRGGRLARLRAAKDRLDTTARQRQERFEERKRVTNEARAAKGLGPRDLRPRPSGETPQPNAVANITDPDSRLLRGRGGMVQGYNAQAVVTADQIVIAAEVTQHINDVAQLAPMLEATSVSLDAAGVTERPGALAADAGYWRAENVNGSIGDTPVLFIAVAKHARRYKPRQDGSRSASKTEHLVEAMNQRLGTDEGKAMMRMRRTTVEPVFGQIKDRRNTRTFSRRGLDAVDAEWKLVCAANNLTKLRRYQLAGS